MIVDVPNKGTVSFPDDLSPEQVEKAIQEWFGGKEAEPAPGTLATAGRAAALGVAPGAAAAAAFTPSMGLGVPVAEAAAPFIGPFAGLIPPATGLLGAGAAGLAAEFGQQKLLQRLAPGFLEKTEAGAKEHPAAAITGRLASALPSFELAPGQAIKATMAIPKILRGTAEEAEKRAVAGLAAQVGAQAGITAAQTGLIEKRLPTAGELLESAAFAGLYGHPRSYFPVPKTIQAQLKDYYASKKREAAAVHEPLPTQSEQGQGGVPVERGGPGVQPRAEAVAQEAQVPLITGSDETGYTLQFRGKVEPGFKTREEAQKAGSAVIRGEREMGGVAETKPEDDLVAQMERAAIDAGDEAGTPVKPVDKLTGEDDVVPFAKGKHGIYLMATGEGAELHRGNFRKWITEDLAPLGFTHDQMKEIITSAVNEEGIHNRVLKYATPTELRGYWNDLSNFERYVETRIYKGKRGLSPRDTPERMANEAIRRRLQQAMKLPPREFLEAVRSERWTIKGLDLLGRMVRGSRELLGTEASMRQKKIYEHILGNIDAATTAINTGQLGPGAERRRDEELTKFIDSYEALGKIGTRQFRALADNLDREELSNVTDQLHQYDNPSEIINHLRQLWQDKTLPDSLRRRARNLEITVKQIDDMKSNPLYEDARRIVTSFGTGEPSIGSGLGPAAERRRSRKEEFAKMGIAFKDARTIKNLYNQELSEYSRAIEAKLDELWPSWREHFLTEGFSDKVVGKGSEVKTLINHLLIVDQEQMKREGFYGYDESYKQGYKTLQLREPTGEGGPEDIGPGLGPAASRRYIKSKAQREAEEQEKLQGQAGMFGNVVKTPSQIPPTPPEQRQAETTRPVGQLENAAVHIFAGFEPGMEAKTPGEGPPIGRSIEPTFQNFLDWARRNVSETIQPGPLFDVWLDTVNKNIENAPGATLNEMVEKLGLQHRVYPWTRTPSKVSPGVEAELKRLGYPAERMPKPLPGMAQETKPPKVERVGTKYTRVEIPDFQQIPPDPGRLPLSVEAQIRINAAAELETRVAQESPMFPEVTPERLSAEQDKAVERARKEWLDYVRAHTTERERETAKIQRELIIKGQRLRSKALSAIYQRVIEEGMPTISDLTPKDITTEDIAWSNPNAKLYGAYHTITPAERASPDKLRSIFVEEARRSSADPVSHTRKLAVMLNRRSGEVALVSAYIHGRRGLMIVEPSGATGKRGKPNVPMQSAMNRGWDPIISVLRKETLKDFYKGFKDIADYNRYLGKEAAELDRTSIEDFVGSKPDDALSDVPEDSNQAWREEVYAREPTEHDLARIMEERERPSGIMEEREGPVQEFIGPMPSEVVGEEFRPGSAVVRGEGGGMIGPEAEIARMGRGERWVSSPLSTREALAIHNWLNDPEEWSGSTGIVHEIESATTQQGMREALQRLYDLAANNQLKPRQWNAIVALRKMALEQYRRDRKFFIDQFKQFRALELHNIKGEARRQAIEDFRNRYEPTPEAAMVTALDRLYEINQISDSQADYLSHTMGEFARPTPEAKTPKAIPGAATQAGVGGPVFQEPPVVQPGELPTSPATGEKQTEPYFPTQYLSNVPVTPTRVGGQKFKGERPPLYSKVPELMPHEFRDEPRVYPESVEKTKKKFIGPLGPGASIREVKDLAEKQWRGIAAFTHALLQDIGSTAQKVGPVKYKRAQKEHDIRAAADGADHAVEIYANELSNGIRAASVTDEEMKRAAKGFIGPMPGKPRKPTIRERLLGGVVFNKEAVRVREAAKALVAVRHYVDDDEWRRVVNAWAEAKRIMEPTWEEDRRLHRRHTDMPDELKPEFVQRGWEGIKPEHFKRLETLTKEGIANAKEKMKATKLADRIIGRRWLRASGRLLREVEYAKEHYKDPEMLNTAKTYLAVTEQHLANMNQAGMNVSGRDYYVPGRYEGAIWADNKLLFGDMRILGQQFRLPKSFRSYYEAVAKEPYIPVNYDLADLAQHSLAAGGRIMAMDAWKEGLKRVIDDVSGKPIAIEPEWGRNEPVKITQPAFNSMMAQLQPHIEKGQYVPPEVLNNILKEAGLTKVPFGFHVPKGKPEYSLVHISPRSKPIAVRTGYEQLVRTAVARSTLREIPVVGDALRASQMLKHGAILILDTFHPGRLLQYAGALAGRNLWGVQKPGYGGGLSALGWAPEMLDEAVKIGAISQKAADWARTPVEIFDRGQIKHMTRQDLLRIGVKRGLNATQTSDTLYRNSIQRIPFIGDQWNQLLSPINKWIFDRITPGVISESFVNNMERINAKNKHLSLDAQVREVVRDMNVFYGNLGRNGVFKHPTARDLAQIILLAPLWQEGLIGKELRSLSRLTGISYGLGRRGLGADVYFGPLVRGVLRGLGAYFVLTQAVNLATRGQWTFQNKEDDHKLDAWIPSGGGGGVWLSPMSVFGEVMHDLGRLGESKPKIWDGITQFGRNKLGPIGRLGAVLAEGKSPTGEQISTTAGVLSRAGSELAPAPISVGTMARAAGHAVAPGFVAPTRPGQLLQRGLGSIGIKTQTATRTETDVRRLANDFVKKHNLAYEPLAFSPTDQASYAKLRGALRNDDESGAAKVLRELRRHRTDDQILKAMKLESQRPFTGSRANEALFLYSLSNDQLENYFKATIDRATDYNKFLSFYVKQAR